VKSQIGDLYPLISDPEFRGRKPAVQSDLIREQEPDELPPGYLVPVAYSWTRTVTCKNPACGACVPLVRQTWLSKAQGRTTAVKIIAPAGKKRARFEVIEASDSNGLGFDPEGFSKGGNATCPFFRTVAELAYIKAEGCANRLGAQLMAVICVRPGERGKVYLSPNEAIAAALSDGSIEKRLELLSHDPDFSTPTEPLEANPRSFDVQHFGFRTWRQLFSARQLIAMGLFAKEIKALSSQIRMNDDRSRAIAASLTMVLGRLADYATTFCTWQPEFIKNTFNSPGLPMVMDFVEGNPIVDCSGSWESALDYVCAAIEGFASVSLPAEVQRGSALKLTYSDNEFDAVVTDPPYYDSRSYSNLSDHFYVWHKISIGHLFPEHFGGQLTPKKQEAIAAPYRHNGDSDAADASYEVMMQRAFLEAHRVLKPQAPFICVYAHKTTAGWATLISALMNAGFTVDEAWPIAMERRSRQNAQSTGALASSILLIARKRDEVKTGNYDEHVKPALEQIVRERVSTLWDGGVSGADLVIACVGAGLRAFTLYPRVEYSNGEEVPPQRFLAEVESVVLDAILDRLSRQVGAKGNGHSLAGVDPATRFYVLWRYTYGRADLDAGEAIVFANGTHVELDGAAGVSIGSRAMVERKKGKYRLRDFAERGDDERLGLSDDDGHPAALIDALHRTLWLLENKPRELGKFLIEAGPNQDQMRLVTQALSGPALRGSDLSEVSSTGEVAALAKLAANWRSAVEDAVLSTRERENRRTGQRDIFSQG
jgi:putative DNA methylase